MEHDPSFLLYAQNPSKTNFFVIPILLFFLILIFIFSKEKMKYYRIIQNYVQRDTYIYMRDTYIYILRFRVNSDTLNNS